MSLDARLNKLIPALTAKERGILVLRSLKESSDTDPLWRSTMPSSQRVEFNRLISLMNVCNIHLAALIIFIEGEVEKLELYEAWLYTLYLWQMNLAEIDFAASAVAREALTESDHRRLVAKAAGQYVPIGELARCLPKTSALGQTTTLKPWDGRKPWSSRTTPGSVSARKPSRRSARAVAAGELEANGHGKALRVRLASFDAAMGRAVTVYPDWAGGYEVVPDDRLAHVAADRQSLAHLQEAIRETPLARAMGADVPEEVRTLDGLMAVLGDRLQRGLALRWTDVLAAERVLEEIGAEFDGEDPLKPASRQALEGAKASIQKLA